jgi:hypothetical protein
MKDSDLERKTITRIERIDLHELDVDREVTTKAGKTKMVKSPPTVAEFIERFLSFDMNATVTFAYEYDGPEAELVIKLTSLETDEEFDNRVAALRAIEEYSKNKAKARRNEIREQEIQTLQKLIKKYKGVVDVN